MSVHALQLQIEREAKAWGDRRAIAKQSVSTTPVPSTRGDTVPAPTPGLQPVYRDPCFRCGVRGDIGCAHQGRAA